MDCFLLRDKLVFKGFNVQSILCRVCHLDFENLEHLFGLCEVVAHM